MRGAPTLPWSPWGIPRQDDSLHISSSVGVSGSGEVMLSDRSGNPVQSLIDSQKSALGGGERE